MHLLRSASSLSSTCSQSVYSFCCGMKMSLALCRCSQDHYCYSNSDIMCHVTWLNHTVQCGGTRLACAVHKTLPFFLEVSLACKTICRHIHYTVFKDRELEFEGSNIIHCPGSVNACLITYTPDMFKMHSHFITSFQWVQSMHSSYPSKFGWTNIQSTNWYYQLDYHKRKQVGGKTYLTIHIYCNVR